MSAALAASARNEGAQTVPISHTVLLITCGVWYFKPGVNSQGHTGTRREVWVHGWLKHRGRSPPSFHGVDGNGRKDHSRADLEAMVLHSLQLGSNGLG